ncbi:death-associated protein 1 isoform X1 [Alligator mississippiensis]|uniref:death-associated protein 1 isoform X1 n=1 Tax=Alligator mississippiensis TaxID=8496 RepID=UPI00287739BC|nr:death-associated protein 1 isoform X1 [Alligator mississippiensis]
MRACPCMAALFPAAWRRLPALCFLRDLGWGWREPGLRCRDPGLGPAGSGGSAGFAPSALDFLLRPSLPRPRKKFAVLLLLGETEKVILLGAPLSTCICIWGLPIRRLNPVKAGGMRIVQKHPHTSDSKEDKDKDDQDWETTSPPKPTVFISGVIARGDKDFPPAAAQVAHQKPHPSVEKLPNPQHVNQHIHQPRK